MAMESQNTTPLIMDPPPPLPTHTPAAAAIHLNYPDSVDSSPRSLQADAFHEPLPQVPGGKLRLMCSYGGHIIPRPHDKSLCYVGGDTRMVVVDRNSSLSILCSRLSRTLLNGRPFSIKYQLPQEELDSLVSVTTDEDLENMIEEYDRISTTTSSSSATIPSRIRLFLFFNKPETVASMGSLLDDAKSETWFVDALNGSGLLPRNLSESATMDCLVSLDHDHELETHPTQPEEAVGEHKNDVQVVLSEQSSMVLEKNSSSGSSSSSPSMSNLPPIRVRVEDQMGGADQEQVAKMSSNFAQLTVMHKQDDGYNNTSQFAPPMSTTASNISPAGGSNEHLNRILSDDERSDHGAPPAGFRKPPLPLHPVQPKTGTFYNLPSPDSVTSDISFASATSSVSKGAYYQDQHQNQGQVLPTREYRVAPASPDNKNNVSVQIQTHQVPDSSYTIPSSQQVDHQQQQQSQQHQQFVHSTNKHYVPHQQTTPLPMSSYYPVYASPSQQPHHLPMDQHYPIYYMPVTQSHQPYLSMQSKMVDTTTAADSSHGLPPPPQTPTATPAASSAYHTNMNAASPEMAAYRTAAAGQLNSLVQMQHPSHQFQQQYQMGYSQMQHPSQSIGVSNANYGYQEYPNTAQDHQAYYAQPQVQVQASPVPPPQYQTMSPASAMALADASMQRPTKNAIQQPANSHQL